MQIINSRNDPHENSNTTNAGWVLTSALDINDKESIVGVASNSILGITEHAFLLAAPVPEPETYAMLLAGLGLIVGLSPNQRNL